MKAINLIPTSERRGGGAGAAGRSGGAAYIVLGALAALVLVVAIITVTNKSVNDKRATLADVTTRATAAEAQTKSLAAYTKFASLRTKRVQTVTSLANSRFDWAHALHEVSRVLPDNAWLLNINGTIAPGAGGGVASSALRTALPGPALDITGCTTSQASVAKVIAAMRRIDGALRVSLQSSQKLTKQPKSGGGSGAASDSGGAGASGGGSESDCRNGNVHFPQFSLVVFLDAGASAAATSSTATASATTAAGTATTPATGTATTPATGTTATTPAAGTATTPAATTPSTGATK